MNIDYKNPQFELFPDRAHQPHHHGRRKHFFSNFTLSLENIIITSICVVMGMVFFFSLGVEKGKRVTARLQAEVIPVTDLETEVDTTASDAFVQTAADIQDIEIPQEAAPTKSFTGSPAHSTIGGSLELAGAPVDITNDVYTIQVASFETERYAKKEAKSLEKRLGYEILVVPKGNYSIVCVGKFPLKDNANTVLHELKKRYKDCLVRRL